jgi:predicted RNase H-like nuclease (RuvC/YqgF family)
MESQIRSTQLEIAKLEAEVTRLQTESALNVAKVEQAEADPQLKVAELQSKLQAKREELELREKLSRMTNDMRMVQSDTQAAVKMAAAAVKPQGGNNGQK